MLCSEVHSFGINCFVYFYHHHYFFCVFLLFRSSVIVYISVTEHPGCFYVSSVDAVSEKLSVEIRERYKVREQNNGGNVFGQNGQLTSFSSIKICV